MSSGFWKDRTMPGPILNVQPGRPPTSNDQPSIATSPAGSLPTLLARMQRAAVTNRLRVEESFKDFDRHRDGTIALPQFQTALSMTYGKLAPISQAEMELLVRTYSLSKGGKSLIRWKDFVADVNKVFVSQARTAASPPRSLAVPPPRRPAASQPCSPAALRSSSPCDLPAISSCDLPMTSHDLPTIPQGLELTPLGETPAHPPVLSRPSVTLSPEAEAKLEALLARLRHRCSVRRVLLKPFFTDAEYNHRSMRVVDHVTKTQFGASLTRAGLEVSGAMLALPPCCPVAVLPCCILTGERRHARPAALPRCRPAASSSQVNGVELDLLCQKYGDDGDGFVNYIDFCCAVDVSEQSSNRSRDTSAVCAAFKSAGNFGVAKTADVQPGRPPVAGDLPSLHPPRGPATAEGVERRLQDKVLQLRDPNQSCTCYPATLLPC